VPDLAHLNYDSVGGPVLGDTDCGAFTIEGACQRLGNIGRTTIYGLIAAGRLEAVKLGSRTLVTAASINALIANLPRATIGSSRRGQDLVE
jgi:excisionase family DNA binding protein